MENLNLKEIVILLEGLQKLPFDSYPEQEQIELLELMEKLQDKGTWLVDENEAA